MRIPASSPGDPLRDLEVAAACLNNVEFLREAEHDGQGDELTDLLDLIEAIRGVPAWRPVEEYQFGWDIWTAEYVTELIQAEQ